MSNVNVLVAGAESVELVADAALPKGPAVWSRVAGLAAGAATQVFAAAASGRSYVWVWANSNDWPAQIESVSVEALVVRGGKAYVAQRTPIMSPLGPMCALTRWQSILPKLVQTKLAAGAVIDEIRVASDGECFMVSGGQGYKSPKPKIIVKGDRGVLRDDTYVQRIVPQAEKRKLLIDGGAMVDGFDRDEPEYAASVAWVGGQLSLPSPKLWGVDVALTEPRSKPASMQPLYSGELTDHEAKNGKWVRLGGLDVRVIN
jgi:hypothetical protein